MRRVAAIFFDFDGVIVESVDVKGWAFGKLFEEFPQYVRQIVAFHHANGGMSRYDKFRFIFKDILRQPLSKEKFDELCRQFSTLVYQRVLECDFVPGALEFLKKYRAAFPMFVVSGTPHKEINGIVSDRGLTCYFKGVFGSPTSKVDWVRQIVREDGVNPRQSLFVGDALSDYEAALENNIEFVARVTENVDVFKGKKVGSYIDDLFQLEKLLQEEK